MSKDPFEDATDAGQTRPPSGGDHPKQIGVYKILRLLGEGGMGIVYEAEQAEPIRRRVALKLLKPGFGTKEVVARFEAERQALAVMDHSGIAKVLEAGVTDDGRPYFIMELVQGQSIRDYCDSGQLSLEQRLSLMIQVSQAVQHAHQKGVIHRDLKPSNVMVTEQDGAPQIKVIDFGLAKALGHRLTEQTLVTQFGQAMGTAAYMSPEQAEMSGLDVDTRADIYSLGVMVYELLVGRLPVDPGQVGYAAFIAQLMLRDTDAPTPRSRFSTLEPGYQESIATFRSTTPPNLKEELGGDVGAIVMKALEKDRNRRYDTANGLARDLQRHLDHEPVAARPPSARYRLRKFVRRNRPAVAASAVAALAVLLGAVLATIGFVRATRAERAAIEAQGRAEREAATATQVSDFLIGLFEVSNPSESRGNEVTAREILDRGAQQIEEELADQPVVQSRLLFTMAQVYRTLGLHQEALRLAEQSLEQRRLISEQSGLMVAVALGELGLGHLNLGHYDEAASYMEEALAIYDTLVEPTNTRVARTLTNLASIYVRQARYDEAVPLFERALTIKVDSFGPDHPELAPTLYNMAVLHRRMKHYDSAVVLYRRTLDIRVEAFGPDDPSVSRTLNGLATVYADMEQFDSAEVMFRQSLEQKERNLGPDHPQVANGFNSLAVVYARQGDLEQALPYFEQALQIRERAYGPDHPRIAQSLNNLGLVYRDVGRFEDSEVAFQRSLAIAEKALGPEHPRVAETLNNYARTLREMGRADEADRLAARADEIEEANRD